jgi:hypothetical protein
MPSSPAKTEVVARLSPGAHRTQSRRCLSAKLAVVEQTLQHAATHHHHHHHHCGRAHRSTSHRVASGQTRSRRCCDKKPAHPGPPPQHPLLRRERRHRRCRPDAPPPPGNLPAGEAPRTAEDWACHQSIARTSKPSSKAGQTSRHPLRRDSRSSPEHGPVRRSAPGSTAQATPPRRPAARHQQLRHALLLLLDTPSTFGPPKPIGPHASPDVLPQPRAQQRDAARATPRRRQPHHPPPWPESADSASPPPDRHRPHEPVTTTLSTGLPSTTFGSEGATTTAAEAGGGSGKDGLSGAGLEAALWCRP